MGACHPPQPVRLQRGAQECLDAAALFLQLLGRVKRRIGIQIEDHAGGRLAPEGQHQLVHGAAALYARTMASIVLRDRHELWTVESTDAAVTVAGRRRGTDNVEESTWSIARADRDAGGAAGDRKRDVKGQSVG